MDEKSCRWRFLLKSAAFIRVDYDIPLAGFAYEGAMKSAFEGKSCPYRQGQDVIETGGAGRNRPCSTAEKGKICSIKQKEKTADTG